MLYISNVYMNICFGKAGNPWTAPDGWDTLHPQLHLNLDDPASGTIYGGAVHLATQATLKIKK